MGPVGGTGPAQRRGVPADEVRFWRPANELPAGVGLAKFSSPSQVGSRWGQQGADLVQLRRTSHSERLMISFMISLAPPKISLTRAAA